MEVKGRDHTSQPSINPTKSGELHGTFKPSPTKTVTVVKEGGVTEEVVLTRRERRKLARRIKKNEN